MGGLPKCESPDDGGHEQPGTRFPTILDLQTITRDLTKSEELLVEKSKVCHHNLGIILTRYPLMVAGTLPMVPLNLAVMEDGAHHTQCPELCTQSRQLKIQDWKKPPLVSVAVFRPLWTLPKAPGLMVAFLLKNGVALRA